MDDHGTDTHGKDAAPVGPCDLARILQDALRSVEQVLRNLLRSTQLPPDVAVEVGDVRRFVACAHEEARQLVGLMNASAHAARWATWSEDLREAVPPVASQQAAHAGMPAARLPAVLDALGPLKIATSALAFAMQGRAPRTALLHLTWIERWLLLAGARMTRAITCMPANGAADGPATMADSAAPCNPEPDAADQQGTPPRRAPRPPPAPSKRLL